MDGMSAANELMTQELMTQTPAASTVLTRAIARLRQAPEWFAALSVGVVAVAMCVIPQWRGDFFYYIGDKHEQFMPMWHRFGERLRSGHWLTMDPDAWMGGNYAAEALTGIWNPVNLMNFVVVSFFNNLSHAAFVIAVEVLGLLAIGAYLLAREYNAARVPAAITATALPVSGFTLWYEAAGWPAGLLAFTWVTYFWWAARRHSRGLLNPFVPFLFGGLAMTTGNPYAPLGLIVVLVAITIELVGRRDFSRLAQLIIMGGCVGAVALLVFLPLVESISVTSRQELAGISNNTFLVPDIGDLAAGSSPTYLPSISSWNDSLLEAMPSTYFAWFMLPLLPWLRWKSLRNRWRSLTSLFVVAGVYLAATVGPSNLWLFRWPLRLIEYFYLAAGVLFAVVLSAGLATDQVRRRGLATGAIVLIGTYLAWAVQPQNHNQIHLAGVMLVAVLLTTGLVAYRRRGLPALGLVLILGTACVVTLQTTAFPHQTSTDKPVYPGYDVARLKATTEDYRGTVLQLASLTGVTREQLFSGDVMFGNMPLAAGLASVGSYTGLLGFAEFSETLCMDYRGATCPAAFDRLWQPVDPDTNVSLIDALRVSTLVVQRSLLPDIVDATPPPGWYVADKNDIRTVWSRERPLPAQSRLSWSSNGITIQSDSAQPHHEVVHYRSVGAGRILFARLGWPGYHATVDGQPVEIPDGPVGLLAVDVPAGEHVLVLTFQTPEQQLGFFVLGVATTIAALQALTWTVFHRRRKLRRSKEGQPRVAAEDPRTYLSVP
jgi:hypothetical protein